jgi:Putative addiction module component
MSEAVSKLLPSLEALSSKDKALVAQRMLELIEEDDEEALFAAELNRRVEECRSGKVQTSSGFTGVAKVGKGRSSDGLISADSLRDWK